MCEYQNNLNILKKSKNEIINYYEENLNSSQSKISNLEKN